MHIDPKAELGKRSLRNWAACIASFTIWAVLASLILPAPFQWVGYAVGIAIAYCVLFFFLEVRPLLISCPKCRKQIATNTPWKCGYCKIENRRGDEVPFIGPCAECGATPKAYKCHHSFEAGMCGKILFLSPDEQEQNYASCLNTETGNSQVTQRLGRSAAREEVLHDIEMAELKERLESVRKRAQAKQEMPMRERLKEDFQKECDVWLSAEDEAEEQRAIAREKYKGNEDKLQKALELIDAWARKHTPG